ncbi:MAG: J domain-containing protein [Cyanobacteriota bacterium]
MIEFDVDELDLETDLQESDIDPESTKALEAFLSTLNIKSAKDVPAFKVISQKSKKILKKFCTGNNHRNRTHKIIDLYKCLDWIPYEDIDFRILDKFNAEDRKILLKDIKVYLNKKEEQLTQRTNWQKEYKQRIVDYYKKTVPGYLKQELENLRDYELNLVGHDRNWRYYFRFNSFKKIDKLVSLTIYERENIFLKFKKDVLSYKINRDRNLSDTAYDKNACNHNWDDDIVKNINWETGNKRQQKHNDLILYSTTKDLATLGLTIEADLNTIKKQYRKLAQVYHPDKPSGNEQKMKEIVSAYHRLLKK